MLNDLDKISSGYDSLINNARLYSAFASENEYDAWKENQELLSLSKEELQQMIAELEEKKQEAADRMKHSSPSEWNAKSPKKTGQQEYIQYDDQIRRYQSALEQKLSSAELQQKIDGLTAQKTEKKQELNAEIGRLGKLKIQAEIQEAFRDPNFKATAARGAAIENLTRDELKELSTLRREDIRNVVRFANEPPQGGYSVPMSESIAKLYNELSIYQYMTDDEENYYYYLLQSKGKEASNAFLDSIVETLNARKGGVVAENIQGIENGFGRTAAEGLFSLVAGVDQAVSGTRQFFTDENLPASAFAFANQEILDDLEGFGRYVYQAGNTVGNMLPSIAISLMTGGAGAPTAVANGIGAVAMGLSAGGNAIGQALDEGYTIDQARTYGLLVGASEGGLQYLLGGIGKLGGISSSKILSKVATIDSILARIALSGAVKIGSEITEEELQNYLEPAFRTIIFGEDYDAPTIEEILETAIVTALSTGALEGGDIVYGEINRNQTPEANGNPGTSETEAIRRAPPKTA